MNSTVIDDQDSLVIAGRRYSSRLLVGTGKYKDLDETGRAIAASGAEIVTVAVRRTNLGQNPGFPVHPLHLPDAQGHQDGTANDPHQNWKEHPAQHWRPPKKTTRARWPALQ